METLDIPAKVKKEALAQAADPTNLFPLTDWSSFEKVTFRFFFLYFFLQAVPLDPKYYRNLFSINWLNLHLSDIFNLTRYTPQIIPQNLPAGTWGLNTFADWAIIAGIAVVGAIIWSARAKNQPEYNQLYYYLRVILRYRLAIGLMAYGFLKLFPLQAPLPSISNLNTEYGDLGAWKIFSMSLGIVPDYQSFLGLVEIFAASLLLFRKTATIGAFIVLPFTGNVFMSNLAYEGGEVVYSFYLVSIALFLFAFDAKRLFSLLTLEQATLPNRFKPEFKNWLKPTRLVLRSLFFLFVLVYGYKAYATYNQAPYHFPETPGLADAAGIYNVTEFKINNQVIPFSETNPDRWQDVVFEKWATISIKSPRPVKVTLANTEEIFPDSNQRNYEETGAGGRHYYTYQLDEKNQVLTLQNKNKNYASEKLVLQITRPSATRIILSGQNEKQEPIYVVLDKLNKKYLLQEAAGRGRREALKL